MRIILIVLLVLVSSVVEAQSNDTPSRYSDQLSGVWDLKSNDDPDVSDPMQFSWGVGRVRGMGSLLVDLTRERGASMTSYGQSIFVDKIERTGNEFRILWYWPGAPRGPADSGEDRSEVLYAHLVGPNAVWFETKPGATEVDFALGPDQVYYRSYGPHLRQPEQ